MKYDPDKHHRRSIRLKGYDYTQVGVYFVTLVTHNRGCLFEDSVLCRVIEHCWSEIPRHFKNVVLDESIVMPNHLHGIIGIEAKEGEAFLARSEPDEVVVSDDDAFLSKVEKRNASPLRSGSLGAIVGNFKSVTARRINEIRKTPGAPVWQRNYYEHIVRNENEMEHIRNYIINNPTNWNMDDENPTKR